MKHPPYQSAVVTQSFETFEKHLQSEFLFLISVYGAKLTYCFFRAKAQKNSN